MGEKTPPTHFSLGTFPHLPTCRSILGIFMPHSRAPSSSSSSSSSIGLHLFLGVLGNKEGHLARLGLTLVMFLDAFQMGSNEAMLLAYHPTACSHK